MSETRREQLKRLIVEAERLMRQARIESREIVAEAERRARELVTAAEDLHRAAAAEGERFRAASAAHVAERRALEARIRELEGQLRESGGDGKPGSVSKPDSGLGDTPPRDAQTAPTPRYGRHAMGAVGDAESDENVAIRSFRRRA